jgi:hypothetical protein
VPVAENRSDIVPRLAAQLVQTWSQLPGYTAEIVPLSSQPDDAETRIIGVTDPDGYAVSIAVQWLDWADRNGPLEPDEAVIGLAQLPQASQIADQLDNDSIIRSVMGACHPDTLPASTPAQTDSLRPLVSSALQTARQLGVQMVEAEPWGAGYDVHYSLGAIDQMLSITIAYTEGQHPDQTNLITHWLLQQTQGER